jgi:murein DD-endopeptidase MepM/ murein hydrolase activator NlpD
MNNSGTGKMGLGGCLVFVLAFAIAPFLILSSLFGLTAAFFGDNEEALYEFDLHESFLRNSYASYKNINKSKNYSEFNDVLAYTMQQNYDWESKEQGKAYEYMYYVNGNRRDEIVFGVGSQWDLDYTKDIINNVTDGIVGSYEQKEIHYKENRVRVSPDNANHVRYEWQLSSDEIWVDKEGVKLMYPIPILFQGVEYNSDEDYPKYEIDGTEYIRLDSDYTDYDYQHYDDFNDYRYYKKLTFHGGNDIMGDRGTPICAVESGTVEKVGWNEHGGWRIGIRTGNKYYYYAHMDGYAKNFNIGEHVDAGDLLGFMGDTGYGDVGASGNFPVHLHFGIEVTYKTGPMGMFTEKYWINPYPLLELAKKNVPIIEYGDFDGNGYGWRTRNTIR